MEPVGTSFQSATAERNVKRMSRTAATCLAHESQGFGAGDFVRLPVAAVEGVDIW
jgi:hypothetical protein